MKRILLVSLLVFVSLFSGFAASKWGDDSFFAVGLSSGFSQAVYFPSAMNNSTAIDNIIPIQFDYMRYVGDNFALNTVLGVDIFLPGSDQSTSWGLNGDLIFYYRMRPTDKLDILIGGGATYHHLIFMGVRTEHLGVGDYVINLIGLVGSLRVQYEVAKNFVLFASAEAGYNLNNNIDFTSREGFTYGEGWKKTFPIDLNIMPWSIRIGFNYNFVNGFWFFK